MSPTDKRFCGDCGEQLRAGCRQCGTPLEAGKRFCGDCGASVAPGDAVGHRRPEPADARVAERRVCSVLFCDLVGFTSAAEAEDPEAVRELLTRYFEVAQTIVSRYGGLVEKFIGDAVMAVWGTPVATEDDAERAVRAALDLIDAVGQLGNESGAEGLTARAGVVTGEMAVTIGATNEGMVAGDAVNTAARIQSAAAAGTLLVDTTTYRLTSGAIGYLDGGEHELKGKTRPEQLWQATRVVSAVGGLQRVDGLEPPLTGRGVEMRLIRDLFHAAVERCQPRLVLVSGPAGVGKSRLGWEFEKYIDGLADTVLWHRGRCLSYGEGLVYWAIAEAVRQRLDIAEEDPPDVAAGKLAVGLEEYVPDVAERSFIEARLGPLLGVSTSAGRQPEFNRDELFAGWRRFLERLAAAAPLTLLIEDAHHADGELLDFLDHLLDWVSDVPLFVLVFARPELVERRPSFGSGRNRMRVAVDPLGADAMDALVDSLIPGAPAAARASIVERAQGVPLYAVESIRALIDQGVVRPVDGSYRLVGDVGELSVPHSLHALLAARLDALDPQARRVLTDAAVLGSSFPAEAVAGVSGLAPDVVAAILSELLRREVLEVSADPLSPERGSYRFAQELLRQVAYDTLSRRDRKARHLAVAAHLRATFAGDGDEVIDVVAKHYVDALGAVPDDVDVGQIRDQAMAALTRAGDRASRSGSPSRAVTNYLDAAELARHSDVDHRRVADLLLLAAQASTELSTTAPHVEIAERAVDAAIELGDDRAVARARTVRGRLLRRLGRHADARLQLTEALDVLRNDPDADTVFAIQQLASVEVTSGGPDANRLTEEALDLVAALDLPEWMPPVLLLRGLYLDIKGRRHEAAIHLREAARLAAERNDHETAAWAFVNLSNGLLVDDPAAAATAARDALDHAVPAGNADPLPWASANLCVALLDIGDWDGASEALMGGPIEHLLSAHEVVVTYRAWLRALRGDPDGAEEQLDQLDAFLVSEDPQDIASIASARAFVSSARGDHSTALQWSRVVFDQMERSLTFTSDQGRWVWPLAARSAHALDDFEAEAEVLEFADRHPRGHVAPMQRAEALLIRARLAAVAESSETASDFATAIAALRVDSTPYHLAHGLLDRAEFLAGAGAGDDAAEAVDEARAIAERLGCGPLLDRAGTSLSVRVS